MRTRYGHRRNIETKPINPQPDAITTPSSVTGGKTDKNIVDEIKKVKISEAKLETNKSKEERLKKFVNLKIIK